MKIYTVSELNLEARETILVAFEYPISVKGEITDFRSSKGHQYFRLRDKSGGYTVECVIWKNTNDNWNSRPDSRRSKIRGPCWIRRAFEWYHC